MPLPDDHEAAVFARELDQYLANCEAVTLAIVTTPDGRLRAQRQRGAYETVIAESAQGLVLFKHIASSFVLVSMTQSKSSLGSLLSWARRTADDIAQGLLSEKIVSNMPA